MTVRRKSPVIVAFACLGFMAVSYGVARTPNLDHQTVSEVGINHSALQSQYYFLGSMLVAGIVLFAVHRVLLERTVVSRLKVLNRSVADVNLSGEVSARVNQRLAVRLLEKSDHQVRVAGNGLEAVAAMDGNAFDLVLLDLQMPEMDGFEATTALREREKETGMHTPVIALTAHALQGDREPGLHRAHMNSQARRIIDRVVFVSGGGL